MTNDQQLCGACDTPATRGWQRYATATELTDAATNPNMPSVQSGETYAYVQVLACDQHAINDDLAALVHDAGCPAPQPDHQRTAAAGQPDCGCSVSTP